MHPTDVRTLLVALRDLLISASGLVNHLLEGHGGRETIVTPPPTPLLALPSGGRSSLRPARPSAKAKPARRAKRRAASGTAPRGEQGRKEAKPPTRKPVAGRAVAGRGSSARGGRRRAGTARRRGR